MHHARPKHTPSGRKLAAVPCAAVALLLFAATPAYAAVPPVGLGTVGSFAVIAGTTVTNTGPSVISGDLGVDPGTAVTGFPPGLVNNGVIHSADAVALQAQSDLTVAYNDAAGRTPPTAIPVDIGGRTLAPGVYKADTELGLTGTVTLDAQSDPNAVFIFQAGSTLITAPQSTVNLIGGAQPCNVFWQVGSSATLGTTTTFVGTIMALTSITLQTGATVAGRVLARNGQVALDTNVITRPACTTTPPVTSTPPVTTTPGTVPPIVITIPTIPGLPTIPGVPPVITIPGLPGISIPGLPGTPGGPNVPGTPGGPNAPGSPNGPVSPAGPNTQPSTTGPGAYTPGSQITRVPNGAVDTGDGSTAPHGRSSLPTALALAATAVLVGPLLLVVRRRR